MRKNVLTISQLNCLGSLVRLSLAPHLLLYGLLVLVRQPLKGGLQLQHLQRQPHAYVGLLAITS